LVAYEVTLRGEAGATVCAAFTEFTVDTRTGCTVVRGIPDQAALQGVLAQVSNLGLEIVELHQLPGDAT
jgi:hypothetical protein